jgi:thioredoxin 1
MNLLTATGALASAAFVVMAPAAAKPPMFSDLSFEQARERAGDRILLVDATADWCPPCQMMDRTTWVDERLVQWVQNNALAIQVDVDAQPHTARELGIRAMPTMIVFRDDREIDRVVGYRDANQMLEWLQQTARADVPPLADEAADQQDREPVAEEPQTVEERLDRARTLARAGEPLEALEHYVWLWENIPEQSPEFAGVRLTFIADEIGALAREHDEARQRFTEIRDRTGQRLEERATRTDLHDWLVLNRRILGEDDRIIAWAERIREEEDGVQTMRRFGFLLAELFEERERLDLLGLLEAHPLRQIDLMWQRALMVESPEGAGAYAMIDPAYDAEAMQPDEFEDPQLLEEIRDKARRDFLQSSARMYASLLAANREQEAGEVAQFVLERVPSQGGLEMIRFAARHGLTRTEHLNWLERVEPLDEAQQQEIRGLRLQIQQQLDELPTPLPGSPEGGGDDLPPPLPPDLPPPPR